MNKVLRALAAIFSIGAALLHWDIWANHQYRFTPVREMFIASAVVGGLVGLFAFFPRRWAAIPVAVANAAFLGAFVLSRVAEVPTFHGGWSEKGLAPKGVVTLGISSTLVLIVCEGLAITFALAALAFGRRDRNIALPAEVARR